MICPNCGHPNADTNAFCVICGAPIAAPAPGNVPPMTPPVQGMYPPVPVSDPFDHTAEFTAQDISDNKVYAMCIYLMGAVGYIIALLAGGDSPYLKFHIRQAMKMTVCEILLILISLTFILAIPAGIALVIVAVLRIIAFFQICKGKAVEPAIIKNLKFLK